MASNETEASTSQLHVLNLHTRIVCGAPTVQQRRRCSSVSFRNKEHQELVSRSSSFLFAETETRTSGDSKTSHTWSHVYCRHVPLPVDNVVPKSVLAEFEAHPGMDRDPLSVVHNKRHYELLLGVPHARTSKRKVKNRHEGEPRMALNIP